MKVLVLIDDNPDILEFYQRVLKTGDREIYPFTSGKIAIEFCEHHHVDLVITDIVMDYVDGLEVIQRLRTRQPGTPILVISGGGRHLDKRFCLNVSNSLGATKGLSKPIEIDELEASVEELLSRKPLSRKIYS